MILSQLISALSSYYILWVADMDVYQTFTELSQMLEVDTSLYSWIVLFIVCAVTLIPVYLLRFRFNALSFTDDETRLMGVNLPALRFVALILGAIMILAAQIHIGAVAMVSLIVPFLSRAWFGCEFRNQLVGNVCISTILLLICRDIADLIPFAYLGIGVGTVVSVAALPIFIFIMARHMRGWE
jgi:iron complex transport system permease protein